jgi:hypothetical protein
MRGTYFCSQQIFDTQYNMSTEKYYKMISHCDCCFFILCVVVFNYYSRVVIRFAFGFV